MFTVRLSRLKTSSSAWLLRRLRNLQSALVAAAAVGSALSDFAQPIITVQPADQLVELDSDATFQVTASGVAPLIYQWSRNQTVLPGKTNSTLLLTNALPGDAGDYSVLVTNTTGSATSRVATLIVDVPVPVFPMTNRWKFNASGVDPGTNWLAADYDDSLWPEGNALFYSANATVPGPKDTLLALTNIIGEPIVSYYFRTHFTFTGSTAGLVLVVTNYVEAGAVFYLNGVELARFRLPNGTITASTPGFVGPEDQANVLLLPAVSLVSGSNVFAVEVHRQSSTNSANPDLVFGMSLKATRVRPPLPDLIIWGPSVTSHFELRTFYTNDCEVLDGCAVPGVRRLLRFATETRNIGTADLVLGNPTNNSLFVYDPCHNHYHFEGYVDFRLLDTNATVVATGKKIGFALVDGERWDTANGNPIDHFDEGNQGIQHGWSDLYDYLLPCQYVDITEVPSGWYTLELEVDPDHKLSELNETNNITRVTLQIPDNAGVCGGAPPNDLFAAAQLVPYAVSSALANSDCATREPDEPLILSNPGGRSVWFRWIAPYSGALTLDTEGSDFDTLLGLYSGPSLNSLAAIAADDDSGAGRTSRIVTNVIAGTEYSIAVDGYYFASFGRAYSGNVVLNLNANANDHFTNAQPIAGSAGVIIGTTVAATKESGEPDHAANPGGHSIWYVWTAPATGPEVFDTFGSRFNTLLAIYTGALGSLTNIANNDDATTNGFSRVTFQAVAGVSYRIAVDGRDGESGLCILNWRPALRLVAPTAADGAFQFTLLGQAGDRCVVDTSVDLVTWIPSLHITNATGSMLLTIPLDPGQKFFRVHTE